MTKKNTSNNTNTNNSNNNTTINNDNIEQNQYKLITSWNAQIINDNISIENTIEILEKQSIISNVPFNINVCEEIPMPLYEEVIVIIIWFLLFGLMLYGPFICLYGLLYHRKITLIILIILFSISLYPTKFNKNSSRGYISSLLLKYFSYRGYWSDYIPTDKPSIVVTPPHGIYHNIKY